MKMATKCPIISKKGLPFNPVLFIYSVEIQTYKTLYPNNNSHTKIHHSQGGKYKKIYFLQFIAWFI